MKKGVAGYRLRVTKSGFSIVEILVAVSIMAIAAAAIYTSFEGGMTSWQRGKARTERYLNARAALDMMTREISAAFVAASDFYDISFVGQDNWYTTPSGAQTDRLDFIYTQAPASGYKYDLSEVAYYWDSTNNDNTLNRRLSRDPFSVSAGAVDLQDCTTGGTAGDLVINVTDLQFQYYYDGTWHDVWDSADAGRLAHDINARVNFATTQTDDEKNNLPRAVKITITTVDETAGAQAFTTVVYPQAGR